GRRTRDSKGCARPGGRVGAACRRRFRSRLPPSGIVVSAHDSPSRAPMTAPPARSTQEYLEALYEMDEEGIPTVQARLAEWLGVSRASVSEAVKRLLRDGLVVSQDRKLAFTPDGEELARTQVRRHRIAEHFLI